MTLLRTITVCAFSLFAFSGCAALSLFSDTHKHTHHHDCGDEELSNRLTTVEQRLGIPPSSTGNTTAGPTPDAAFGQ